MRIFYASSTSPNADFQSDIWRKNLLLPLKDLGHDVVEFQYDLQETFRNVDPADPHQKAFIEKNRPVVSAELLRQIRVAHEARPVDLFFSYFYDACVFPQTIDEIRAMGIVTVNWYCNGSYQLHLVSEISPHYDWCLVPEKFRLKDYVAIGARPIYCQEAANPTFYRPLDLPRDFDVTFVGQAYGDRPAYIRRLLLAGIDVRVWGTGWERFTFSSHGRQLGDAISQIHRRTMSVQRWDAASSSVGNKRIEVRQLVQAIIDAVPPTITSIPDRCAGGVLSDDEMIAIYSRSKINLGFSTCGNTHLSAERIVQVRLRDFEIPMSGGFYMVEYMEELEEFYKIGEEIVCYRGPDDLVEKVAYYLRHDNERERIRLAGLQRCRQDHTWHRRFERAFNEMGIA